MGSVIHDIGKRTHDIFHDVGAAGGDVGNLIAHPTWRNVGRVADPKHVGDIIDPTKDPGVRAVLGLHDKPPGAPGPDPNMTALKNAQVQNANDFRANMPGMASQMGDQLSGQARDEMQSNLSAVKGYNSRRGLLYGGIEQGAEQGERARTAGALAAGKSNINRGLIDQSNALDTQAIQSGVQIQQTQQSMQNAIYGQALAQMQGQNQAMGGLLQAGVMLAML